MSAALSRASIVSAALGLGVGITVSYIYYRLQTPKGRYKNPNWGMLRVRGVKLAQQESGDSAAQAAQSMVAAVTSQATPDEGAELSRKDSIPLADLPESILKKHPKGYGMELVKIDAPVRARAVLARIMRQTLAACSGQRRSPRLARPPSDNGPMRHRWAELPLRTKPSATHMACSY
jgi:hypothetical protein